MSTGKFEESTKIEENTDDVLDRLTKAIADESKGLIEVFKAEREIVSSIIEQHISTNKIEDSSTD